jgi:hypothetical protein
VALACASSFANAQAGDLFETTAANLLPVLRESRGANKPEPSLQPYGRMQVRLPDGREVDFEASWFQWLGDMHLRLVFDGHKRVQSALPDDLQRLHLSPQQALEQAVANLRRRYGAPQVLPFGGSLMQVQAAAPELASSYFLDRDLWLDLEQRHPGGIVAAVPLRQGIVFAPADDTDALTSLQFSASALYWGDEGTRISSALYLFKDGRWSVFQPPQRH